MNKAELIQIIAEKAELTKVSAERALTILLDEIAFRLRNDEPVVLLGFGAFTIKNRRERNGRNPKTGEAITIKPAKGIAFKAGKALKEAVKK